MFVPGGLCLLTLISSEESPLLSNEPVTKLITSLDYFITYLMFRLLLGDFAYENGANAVDMLFLRGDLTFMKSANEFTVSQSPLVIVLYVPSPLSSCGTGIYLLLLFLCVRLARDPDRLLGNSGTC